MLRDQDPMVYDRFELLISSSHQCFGHYTWLLLSSLVTMGNMLQPAPVSIPSWNKYLCIAGMVKSTSTLVCSEPKECLPVCRYLLEDITCKTALYSMVVFYHILSLYFSFLFPFFFSSLIFLCFFIYFLICSNVLVFSFTLAALLQWWRRTLRWVFGQIQWLGVSR